MDLSNENVIHVKKDGVEYLQFRKLLEYKDILKHAYSLGINTNFRTARANKEKLPSLVRAPIPITKRPLARGSKVPKCPTRLVLNLRQTTLTTSREV